MTVTQKWSGHGSELFTTHDEQVAGRNGFVAGGKDKPSIVFPSPDTVAVFEDFLGDTGELGGFTRVSGDTGFSGSKTSATNGVYRLNGSETQGVAPTACQAITGGLMKNWKIDSGGPKNGRVRMAWRGKFDSVSRTAEAGRLHAFIGLADTGGAEQIIYDTGAGIISAAADYVGFMFSAGGDTGWSLVAGKSTSGDSGDQLVVAGSSYGPSANTYTVLEMEIRSGISDTGAAARFWIDGKSVGTISSPVNSAVALTPWIGYFPQDTGWANAMDTDYVNISAARDTGE